MFIERVIGFAFGIFSISKVIQIFFLADVERSRAKTTGYRLTDNEKPVEYVYWDNINELVERLKLFMASKEAGNNYLDNEIFAIINKLKEVNVINE